MILHQPTTSISGDSIQVSSRFEFKAPLPHVPQNLWYSFPREYENLISPQADGFAAIALLVSMLAGENLEVRGSISPRLAYNLLEYRNIFSILVPKIYQFVEIKYQQLEPPAGRETPPAVATAFSGGIDSFFSLWDHLPENQPVPQAQITHGLYLYGLDTRLEDRELFKGITSQYDQLFSSLGLTLIQGATNAYLFSQYRVDWTLFFGPPLIGAAHLLSPLIGTFYVPSGFSYTNLIPHGSSPLIDHLLSSENLNIVHHGTSTSRMKKLEIISNWQPSHQILRVCPNHFSTGEFSNCGACEKCIRTQVMLAVLRVMGTYTFSRKLGFGSFLRWGLCNTIYPLHLQIIRNEALASGRVGLGLQIQLALLLGRARNFIIDLIKKSLSADQLYRLKRKIYNPRTDPRENL